MASFMMFLCTWGTTLGGKFCLKAVVKRALGCFVVFYRFRPISSLGQREGLASKLRYRIFVALIYFIILSKSPHILKDHHKSSKMKDNALFYLVSFSLGNIRIMLSDFCKIRERTYIDIKSDATICRFRVFSNIFKSELNRCNI